MKKILKIIAKVVQKIKFEMSNFYFNFIFRRLLNGCDGNYVCFCHHDGHRAQFLLPWSYINACPCMGSNVRL